MRAEAAPAQRPRDFHLRWRTLQPPLRPHAIVVAQMADLLRDAADPLLLLGVTPELAAIDCHLIAADWNPVMIDIAWPGDTDRRRAICADWCDLPLTDGSVGGALSDGALTMFDWPDGGAHLMASLARVFRPGGRVVIRCFACPEEPETLADLDVAPARGEMSFHEWRMRFNMAAARADGGVGITSARLYEHYDAAWPDRHGDDGTPGWPGGAIAEIDAYRGSSYIHSYPKRSELDALMAAHWPGTWHFAETSGYPGASFCPLLVADRA